MFERFYLRSIRFLYLSAFLSSSASFHLQITGSIAVKSISTHNFAIVPDNVPVIVHIDSVILAKKEGDVKVVKM